MRYKLLSYCLNPRKVIEEKIKVESLFESQFEKDVYNQIIAKGYYVRPQVQVNEFRIDLVVEDSNNRLAIECDGDKFHGLDQWEKDFWRQKILERCGWKFWRIRASQFYRNRERALEPLWAKLHELNILPQSNQ